MKNIRPEKVHWDWWVDFIEGEMEADLMEEASLLLRHSTVHQLIVNNIGRLRNLVHASGYVPVPRDEKYYNDLHAKIMSKVGVAEKRPQARARASRR